LNIKCDISDQREATLTVEVPTEVTEAEYDKALSIYKKKANIPGFRPGRAPLKLIKRRFGADIKTETAQQITRDYLEKAVEAEKLEVGGQIDLELIEHEDGKPLKFKASFPLRPEVTLSNYKGIQILVNDAEVSDADVEKRIEAFRTQHSVMKSVDSPAEADAQLTVKVQEVDSSGLPLVGMSVDEKTVQFGEDQLGVGTDEQLMGVAAGETRVITARQTPSAFVESVEQTKIITPDQASQDSDQPKEITLSVEVERVEVAEKPEIDEAFVKQVNDQLESVEDLNKWIKGSLFGYIAVAKQQWMEKAIVTRLIEDNPFVMSPKIYSTPIEELADDLKLEGDEREKFIEARKEPTERDYRWVFLYNEVAKAEGIEVTDDELEQEIVRIAEQSGDSIRAVRQKFSDEASMDRLRRRLVEREVIQFLAESAKIESRTMNLDEFVQTANAEGIYI